MSKRKRSSRSRRGAPAPSQAGGAASLAQQVQKMQKEMLEAQEALADETLEVTAGGGAVTIVITGHQRVLSLILKPEVVDPEDVEMLQDLLLAAINQAIEQSQDMAAERLEGLTGGFNLPGF